MMDDKMIEEAKKSVLKGLHRTKYIFKEFDNAWMRVKVLTFWSVDTKSSIGYVIIDEGNKIIMAFNHVGCRLFKRCIESRGDNNGR